MEVISRFFQIPDGNCFLFGLRGTGKSTWLRHQLPDAPYLDLIDPELYRCLTARPAHSCFLENNREVTQN